jgi:hypothetical protein
VAEAELMATARVTSFRAVTTAAFVLDGPREARHDIPAPAFSAYQRAAGVLEQAAPDCRLPWTLLAAIGRVESDHGRHGGAVLDDDGVARPYIIGVALDGTGQVAEIRDTDRGRMDGDTVWDRAVGPMQFLPTTWDLVGVDGDGDGVRNPHDIDDAALAAGVYLCAGGGDLTRLADMRAAVFRYNHSESYVSAVMAYERGYRLGRYVVDPDPTGPTAVAAPSATTLGEVTQTWARERRPEAGRVAAALQPAGDVRTQKGSHSGPTGPALAPARVPDPTPVPTPDPDPTPTRTPDRTADPDPTPTRTPDPPNDPEPVEPTRMTVEGVWTACDEGYCLDGNALLLGDREQPGGPAERDFDGDGDTESLAEELLGLVGQTVTVVVDQQETGWAVLSINDLAYPREEDQS